MCARCTQKSGGTTGDTRFYSTGLDIARRFRCYGISLAHSEAAENYKNIALKASEFSRKQFVSRRCTLADCDDYDCLAYEHHYYFDVFCYDSDVDYTSNHFRWILPRLSFYDTQRRPVYPRPLSRRMHSLTRSALQQRGSELRPLSPTQRGSISRKRTGSPCNRIARRANDGRHARKCSHDLD